MNRLIIIAVLLASGCTMAFSQYVDTRRLITVSGEARTDLPPDIAYVTIGVEIDGLIFIKFEPKMMQRFVLS